MYIIKNKLIIAIVLMTAFIFSCKDLVELNENPNGVDPEAAHPNLILSTVVTEAGKLNVNLGYGDIAGVMQHTQKDGWSDSHNNYAWASQSWSGYYGILRNNDAMYKKAEAQGLEFQMGVGLVMKSYVFGLITDLWGDAPYSEALKGEFNELQPKFDTQEEIYSGILADLETANTLLSKDISDYMDLNPTQDPIYKADPAKWRKFANSLALRYYLRISDKNPAKAKEGIERIAGDPDTYPVISSYDLDANMKYLGTTSYDSWPNNTVFDASGSNYRRIKMCSILVNSLMSLNDPRLNLWANPVQMPLVIDPSLPPGKEVITGGKRYVAVDIADDYMADFGIPLDTNQYFVGMPPAWSILPQAFNLSPDLNQAAYNPHVSWLNSRYEDASGDLLKSRMLTAAETHFILAEAALKGWNVGSDAKSQYESAIEASFDAWGIPEDFEDYVTGEAAYNGTIAQIMEQKWIASWTAATEAWFDYRRTGLPDLQAGPYAKRPVLPVRFYYSNDEELLNTTNTAGAIEKLEPTQYTNPDGRNSAWSKTWVIAGTGEPWQ